MDVSIMTKSPFLEWFVGVPVGYFFLLGSFRLFNLWPKKVRKGSRSSDIIAFEITALTCVVYLSAAGVIGNLELFGVKAFASYDPFVNIYKRSPFVEAHLLAPMIAYQFWNLLLCIFNSDLGSWEMIIHHGFAATASIVGMHPYQQQNALYFYGVTEITNIPLTVVDVFKFFPELKQRYPTVNALARYSFAASYTILRLMLWPFQSVAIWKTSIQLLNSGEYHSFAAVIFVLVTHIALTILQYFWGYKIFSFLGKTGKSGKSPSDSIKAS